MKKIYGSFQNRLIEDTGFPVDYKVEVGSGATECCWSDRYPYTVCSVEENWNNKGYEIIGIQADNYKRIDSNGFSESQEYEYTPNTDASVRYLKSSVVTTENGDFKIYETVDWSEKARRWVKGDGNFGLGRRSRYCDPSF
jgi:hypothetical protein